jgi:hypothetical protein
VAKDDEALTDRSEQVLTAYIAKYLHKQMPLEAVSVPAVLGVLVRYLASGTAGESFQVRRSCVWHACSVHPDDGAQNEEF